MTCPACKGSRERFVTVPATDELVPRLPQDVTHHPRRPAYAVCDVCSGHGKLPDLPEPQAVP